MMHLFLQCPYIKEVWGECSKAFGIPCIWEGLSILQAWENWRRTVSQELMTALPLLVIWGVWLAQNNLIFAAKGCTPEITSTLAGGILSAFPQHIRVNNQREVFDLEIDRSVPWGFFDGAASRESL